MLQAKYFEPDRGFAAHGLRTENGVAMGNARPGPDPGRDAVVGPAPHPHDGHPIPPIPTARQQQKATFSPKTRLCRLTWQGMTGMRSDAPTRAISHNEV